MPQLDFNVLLNNFLLVLLFFVFFYIFLNFFFLRRIFSLVLYRSYLTSILAKKAEYISLCKLEISQITKDCLDSLVKIIKLL